VVSEDEAEVDMVLQWDLWVPWAQWDLWGQEVQVGPTDQEDQDSEDEEVQDSDHHHQVTEDLHPLGQEAPDLDTEAHPLHLTPTGAQCPHHHQAWEAQWDHLECHQWVLWGQWDPWVHQDLGVVQWDPLGVQVAHQIKITKTNRTPLGEWT